MSPGPKDGQGTALLWLLQSLPGGFAQPPAPSAAGETRERTEGWALSTPRHPPGRAMSLPWREYSNAGGDPEGTGILTWDLQERPSPQPGQSWNGNSSSPRQNVLGQLIGNSRGGILSANQEFCVKCWKMQKHSIGGDKTPTATPHGHQGAAHPPHTHHHHPLSFTCRLLMAPLGMHPSPEDAQRAQRKWSPNCHLQMIWLYRNATLGEDQVVLFYFPHIYHPTQAQQSWGSLGNCLGSSILPRGLGKALKSTKKKNELG